MNEHTTAAQIEREKAKAFSRSVGSLQAPETQPLRYWTDTGLLQRHTLSMGAQAPKRTSVRVKQGIAQAAVSSDSEKQAFDGVRGNRHTRGGTILAAGESRGRDRGDGAGKSKDGGETHV